MYSVFIHKVEVNFNDATGWHDLTSYHKRLWKEWPKADHDAWIDEEEFAVANGILSQFTFPVAGTYIVDARVTWLDGTTENGETSLTVTIF